MNNNMEEINLIWESLRATGEYDGITISQEVRDSWVRCEEYGVDPYKPCCDVVLTAAELKAKRAENRPLLEQAAVMMGHLHNFTEGSGFAFNLYDSKGYLLKRTGDRESLELSDTLNIIEGARCSENVIGTTAGSLSHILRKPMQLSGYEHFCRFVAVVTEASSPIFGDEDNIIGVLNILGPYHMVNRHTMGMAIAASRAIERQMALQSALQQSEMENLYKTTIMDSMSDGVITLDRKGRIIHMNVLAGQSLGIGNKNVLGCKLEHLMLPNNELFFSKISDNKQLSEPLAIKRKNDVVKLAVSSTPLTDKNGKILGTVVILQPLQKYKRLIEKVSGTHAKITFEDIIGQSSELKFTLKFAQIAARSDSNVLLLGESGVGKEMFAQAIHNASNRSKEPFFAINCAALPRELISSELFGYEEGAFTGARKGGNPGKFELADQGTLFLDEIGEMPLDLQGSLLRFLEEGTIMRLGGREMIPVNVRVIAATNKNLLEEVKKENFRLDLYYRIKVIDIEIPSLRERKDDIPRLVEHFIKIIGPRLGKNITGIDDKAMNILFDYDWPGNVRELNNIIERAINLTSGSILTEEDLPSEIKQDSLIIEPAVNTAIANILTEENLLSEIKKEDNTEYISPWKECLNTDAIEEQLIRNCLKKHGGNRNLAAKELGMSRATIFRKIKKYSINDKE